MVLTNWRLEPPTDHSIASWRPSPLRAEVLKIAHVLFFKADSPNALDISGGVMAPSISCSQ